MRIQIQSCCCVVALVMAFAAACVSDEASNEVGEATSAVTTTLPTFWFPAAQPATTYTAAFLAAVATPNAIVRIAGNAQVDLSGLERVPVAAGVQLIGERPLSATGAMLYTTSFPSALLVLGDHVRITGLRIRGGESDDPFSAVDQSDSNGIQIESKQNIEIDHCEVDHWRGSAVAVIDLADRLDLEHADSIWIHDDFIHHNQHPTADTIIPHGGHGAGYGVQMSHGGYALIERNVFDYNRHNIMGDGSAGTGYLAYRNLILPHGGINSREVGVVIYTHALDMHGSDTCGVLGGDHNCGLAGEYADLQYNTVLYTRGTSVKLRGTPEIRMNVANNVFASDQDDAIEQNETGLAQATNAFGLDTSGEIRYCDFDGDGTLDPVIATGVTWWYAASSRNGRWTYLYNSVSRAAALSLGDVNGDGRCDVTVAGSVLYGSDAGLAAMPPPGAIHGSALAAAHNQDGRLQLFGASAGSLVRRSQATASDVGYSAWTGLDGILTAVASETNADGRIELVGVNKTGSIWRRSQLAATSDSWSPWTQLDGLLVSVAVARNADGRLELFGTNSAGTIWHRWQTAAGGTSWSAWQSFDGLLATIAAETNADGRIELVGVNAQGAVYHRWQTAGNSTIWSGWFQLDGALAQIALARNADGRLEMVGTTSAGTVLHRAQTAAGSIAWSGWGQLDDSAVRAGSLAAEANADGRLELYGVLRVGEVVHRWQLGNGAWSAWAHVPGGLAASVPELRGLRTANAAATLTAAGYGVATQSYVDISCSLAPGFVIQQDPPVGPAVIFSGAPIPPITIWVSELPNLSGCNG